MQGVIKSLGFNGFGFVQPFDGGPKVFFHANDVDRDFDLLVRGDALEFDVVQAERGPECRNVHVVTPLRETTVGIGKIKTLSEGHGTIASEGRDVFFHFRPSFRVTEADIGRSVDFKSVETGFGPQAVSVCFTDTPGCEVGSQQNGMLVRIKSGFGFIACNGREFFCHFSQIPFRVSKADEGRRVEFTVAKNAKGLLAEYIRFTDE
jgi:cold shock CspA family protein